MLLSILIGCMVVLLAIAWYWRGQTSEEYPKIPGIQPSNSERGNLDEIGAVGGLPYFLEKMHAKFGPIFSFWFRHQYCVSIASHQLFKEQVRIPERPPILYDEYTPMFTQASITYADVEEGRRRRRLYDTVLTHAYMVNYYETLQNVVNGEMKKLHGFAESRKPIELSTFMLFLAIQGAAKSTFGKFMDHDTVYQLYQSYQKSFEVMQGELKGRTFKEGVDDVILKEGVGCMHDTVRAAIAYRRKQPAPPGEHLLIDVLLESGFTDDVIFGDAVTYVIAGFHTTGYTLTWLVYYLLTNPGVEKKILDEIKTALPTGEVLPDNRKDLVYLKAVIDETLRCSRLAPYAARSQSDDCTIGGYHIPAQTPVIQALGVSMHNPDVYPDPERFDPDRFLNRKLPGFAFEPFGFAGKRQCPANQFSYLEITIVIVNILPRFRFRLVDETPVKGMLSLVTFPERDIMVTVEHRK